MKKIFSVILVSVLALAMLVPAMTVSAFQAVGNLDLNYGSVAIDGNFSADKWAAATVLKMDDSNAVAWALDITSTVTLYALWDEAGLYFGGDIADSTFLYSDAGAGYNGDSLQLSLDVGQLLVGSGEDRAIFYSFGCFEDPADQVLVRQTSMNDGNIEDGEGGLQLKTKATATGWTFEMLMPWSMLLEDISEKSGKTFTPAAGGKIDLLMCYLDHNDDGLGAWGTFTAEDPDWGPEGHGVTYTLLAQPAPEPEPEPEPEPVPEPTPEPPPAEAEPQTPAGPAAPPTGDTLAICALFVLAIAAALFALSKRIKSKNTI